MYLSLYLKGCVCERELEAEQNCNILTPTLMAISVVSFSFSRAGGLGAQFSAGWWLSLPHLVSNSSDLQLTDFLSPPRYIIVQSPTQSLEWHFWSSSSGNSCHAVHRSLSSGASVYACTMGFYLVPYCPPTRFLLVTAIGMCHFLPVHHLCITCLAGSKVNIQHTDRYLFCAILLFDLWSTSKYFYQLHHIMTYEKTNIEQDKKEKSLWRNG